MYDIDNKVVDFIITNIDIKKKILIFDRDKTRKNLVYFIRGDFIGFFIHCCVGIAGKIWGVLCISSWII